MFDYDSSLHQGYQWFKKCSQCKELDVYIFLVFTMKLHFELRIKHRRLYNIAS